MIKVTAENDTQLHAVIERLLATAPNHPKHFATLRAANIARDVEWRAGHKLSLSFRGNELAGEVGEACNVLKKLDRERLGLVGSRATIAQAAEELADVVICADLAAMDLDIDLGAAVAAKFDATSEKRGLKTRMGAPSTSDSETPAQPERWRHITNGGEYVVCAFAKFQTEAFLTDMPQHVVYRSLDTGETWVRPTHEFFDGRFERVTAGEAPEAKP